MRPARAIWFWGAVATWLAAQWLAVAFLPLLSEDWTHLAMVAQFDGFLDCFDPAHPPPRPLQHAFFWVSHELDAPAGAMRGAGFALHLASVVVLAALAASAGLDRARARAAAALFAAYPVVRAAAWPAAVSGPGHVLFELGALLAFAQSPAGSWRAAARAAPLLLVALAWHPSAVLTPLALVAWRAFVAPGEGSPARRALQSLREPAVAVAFVLAAAALAWILQVPTPRSGVRVLGAIAANGARAAVFWLPEPARVAIVEALRGGGTPRILGLAALAAIALVALRLWLRGGALFRFALFAVAIDLGLTTVKAGFSLRYALLSAALLALASAGAGLAATAPRWSRLAVLLLGASFAVDSMRDVADFAEAGRGAARLLARADAARAAVDADRPLWIVDPPPEHGREGDIPVWNWGLRHALAARGVGNVRAVTTLRSVTASTDVERVDSDFVARLLSDADAAVLVCRPDGEIELLPPGRVVR